MTIDIKDASGATQEISTIDDLLEVVATAAGQSAAGTLAGAVDETAPETDTASAGLNGRLQRIAQRLSSLIALLPTALGGSGGLKTEGVGTAGTPAGGVASTQAPAAGATLTKTTVTMGGSSATLVGASSGRLIVMVSNAEANAPAAIDPTGGTCALDAGIPVPAGSTIEITGKAAQSAMTQIGTNAQKLTVYTG